jgi:hypothetical protein
MTLLQTVDVNTVGVLPREKGMESKGIGQIASGAVAVHLIKSKIDPARNDSRAKHGAKSSFNKADCPKDEGHTQDDQWDIAIGDLSDRRSVNYMIRHDLSHCHRYSR